MELRRWLVGRAVGQESRWRGDGRHQNHELHDQVGLGSSSCAPAAHLDTWHKFMILTKPQFPCDEEEIESLFHWEDSIKNILRCLKECLVMLHKYSL